MPFDSRMHKAGKWLKFELGERPQVVLVANNQVQRGTLMDEEDLDLLLDKAQRSADGRLVGIYVAGGRLRVPGSSTLICDDEGIPLHDPPQYKTTPERFFPIPDCVAPIRAVLGADGSHNLQFALNGQAHRLLLALDSLDRVDLVLVREDIPAFRNATLDSDFDPKLTAKL